MVAHPAVPALPNARLDRYARAHVWWQHAGAVVFRLLQEQFPAWEADHPRLDALFHQLAMRFDRHRQLGAGRHQDQLGRATLGLDQHIRAAQRAIGRAHVIAIKRWQLLAAKD